MSGAMSQYSSVTTSPCDTATPTQTTSAVVYNSVPVAIHPTECPGTRRIV